MLTHPWANIIAYNCTKNPPINNRNWLHFLIALIAVSLVWSRWNEIRILYDTLCGIWVNLIDFRMKVFRYFSDSGPFQLLGRTFANFDPALQKSKFIYENWFHHLVKNFYTENCAVLSKMPRSYLKSEYFSENFIELIEFFFLIFSSNILFLYSKSQFLEVFQ